MTNETQAGDRLFDFSALMDLTFKKFITISVIKILYLLGIGLLGLTAIILVIVGFASGVGAGIGALILAPIIFLIWLLFLRIYLELIVVLFRIAENTSIMAGRSLSDPVTTPAPAV